MHVVFALVLVVFVTVTVLVGITNTQNAYDSILAEAQQWQRENSNSCGRDVSDCGLAKMVDNFQSCSAFRVYNGCAVKKPVTVGWQAVVFMYGSRYGKCSGVLIGPQHILTAAHCLLQIQTPTSIKVVLGVRNIKNIPASKFLEVSAFGIHPKYNKSASLDFDIGFVKLTHAVLLNKANGIRAACIPTAVTETTVNQLCLFSGFGTKNDTYGSTEGAGNLRYTLARRQTNQICKLFPAFNPATSLCTLGERDLLRTGPCSGDSGSALLCTDDSGRWVVTGIFSYTSNGRCTDGPTYFGHLAKLDVTISSRESHKQKCSALANNERQSILSVPAAGNVNGSVLCKPQYWADRKKTDLFWTFKVNSTHPLCQPNLPKPT